MSEKPWENFDLVKKTESKEVKEDLADNEIGSRLFAIKKEELKDTIDSFFDDFNNEIQSKTPNEISLLIDEQMKDFFDFQWDSLKNLPDSILTEVTNLIHNLQKEVKSKSLDWDLSKKDRQEITDIIFKYANQLAKTIIQEVNYI